jgi:hypothetical protein
MKIVSIIESKLYSIQNSDSSENELRRLLNCWMDIEYLDAFLKKNVIDLPRGISKENLIMKLVSNSFEIQEMINRIENDENFRWFDFFKPLQNSETGNVILSKQKGRQSYLRLYAVKIEVDCFIITGGAIKFHHLNKDREHTYQEMLKLNRCRDFLKDIGIYDRTSFVELISTDYEK